MNDDKVIDDKVLKFVVFYKAANNGNSPSYDEIVEACGVWKSQVGDILERLEQSGKLRQRGTRSISLPNSRWSQEAE